MRGTASTSTCRRKPVPRVGGAGWHGRSSTTYTDETTARDEGNPRGRPMGRAARLHPQPCLRAFLGDIARARAPRCLFRRPLTGENSSLRTPMRGRFPLVHFRLTGERRYPRWGANAGTAWMRPSLVGPENSAPKRCPRTHRKAKRPDIDLRWLTSGRHRQSPCEIRLGPLAAWPR